MREEERHWGEIWQVRGDRNSRVLIVGAKHVIPGSAAALPIYKQ